MISRVKWCNDAMPIAYSLKNIESKWHVLPIRDDLWRLQVGEWYFQKRLSVDVIDNGLDGHVNDKLFLIKSNELTIHFTPQNIKIAQFGTTGFIEYNDLDIKYISNRFVEEKNYPSDAKFVGYTWLHTTKDGYPDLRYSINPQLSVFEYGVIHFVTKHGLNIYLQLSNSVVAQAVAQALQLWVRDWHPSYASSIPQNSSGIETSAGKATIQQSLTSNENSAGKATIAVSSLSALPSRLPTNSPSYAKMFICHDLRTGDGCGHRCPPTAKMCANCGSSLRYAMEIHMPESTIHEYHIDDMIGYGNNGVVYRAKKKFGGNVSFAVKEIFDSKASLSAQQEFESLVHLTHPNLPRYYDYFNHDGNGYLVMEYVPGQSLEELQLNYKILPIWEVLAYGIQIADALIYLHKQDPILLHRDIKPDNIRVKPNNDVKLVDFGLIKRGLQMTRQSGKGLTPAYAPIEQYSGGTDERVDIYSLGATVYQLITGQTPSPSTDRIASPDTLVPPGKIVPNLDPSVEQVVIRAMAIHRDQRYASAEAFRDALMVAQHAQVVYDSQMDL